MLGNEPINKPIKFIVISILFTHISAFAHPHISGSVRLNREKGLFLWELELSNLSEVLVLQKWYNIIISSQSNFAVYFFGCSETIELETLKNY